MRDRNGLSCFASSCAFQTFVLQLVTQWLSGAAFKTKGFGFATFLKDKTVQGATQLKQKSTEPDASGQTAYDRMRLATAQ